MRNKSNGSNYKNEKGRANQVSSSTTARQRVPICDLFRFATFADSLLILTGSVFALLEGAGPATMALVFGGMTNILVSVVKNGLAPATNVMPLNNTTTTTPAPGITPMQQTTDLLLTPEQFESSLATFSLLYVAIGVAVYVSSFIHISCWQTACERQTHRIRRAFFCSVLRQELAWFDKNQAGELSAKLNDDIERIRDGIGEQFSSIIKYSSSFISGFVVGFIVSWRLTLVILIATPLLAIFSAYMGRMLATSTKREQEKYAKAGALAEEVLAAIRTVFALCGQRAEIKRYAKRLNESKRMALWKYLKLSILLGCSMFVLYATYGLALYVATQLLAIDLIDPGAAMTVIMSVMMGASALGNIIPPFQTVAMATSSASLIFNVIDSVPRIDAFSERGLKLSKITANIKFEHVTFSYPTRRGVPVIRNLNFELNQGQTVAICGRTGSGKSTIINLLLRFYDPDEGAIYLDNCNLCDLNVAWLRSLVGIVEQEPALFDCSIYENIALGASHDVDRTHQRIVEAAKLANAHEFITNLPDGYQTRCGDRGVQMSGGQKQRISIARALLSDPKILLLDEATSALDSENESIVQSALNRARQGRTTIVIAHRLSTIRDADLICVMDSGFIVEQGRHEELMANRAEYYNLVTNQVFSTDDKSSTSSTGATQQQVASSPTPAPPPLPQSEARNGTPGEVWAAVAAAQRRASSDSQEEQSESEMNRRQAGGRTSDGQSDDDDDDERLFYGGALVDESSRLVGEPQGRRRAKLSATEAAARKKYAAAAASLYESFASNRPLKSGSLSEHLQQANGSSTNGGGGECPPPPPTFWDIIKLARPELKYLLLGTLANVVCGGLLPTFAMFYAQIFDTFTKTGDDLLESGRYWALMFVALAAAMFVAMFFRCFLMAFAIETTLARLRAECFGTILRQHVGWFDDAQHSPQRLTTRLATDAPQIKAVLNARLSALISGLATIVVALIIAFYLGWQLAILLTIALPILLYVGYLQMRQSRGDRANQMRRMENASRLATEAIEHVKLIQAINQERKFFDKFNTELQEPLRDSLSAARRFGLIYGLSQGFIFLVYGAAFRWGAYLMARSILTPIDVFRIFFSIAFTAVAVGQWGGIGGDMSRANHSLGMLIKLLNTKPEIDNLSRGGLRARFKGHVMFQDVHFRYPSRPDTPVLSGLNLTVKAGETLALVGPSGNGKSTLAALLLRFYDPDRGAVRIDNYDVRCINLSHLRLNVGLVSQEPILFKASIVDNILYGLDKSRYTMRDVISAARLANIDEFIVSLPNGYHTQVGDRGCQLSGGQKQRIAIARTMIRNPTILILDEATSALDSESETLVNQALERASRGKTCIKIAHRLSTVRDANQIAVVEQGQIVEVGTHDELMALGRRGHYFRLMQKQQISS